MYNFHFSLKTKSYKKTNRNLSLRTIKQGSKFSRVWKLRSKKRCKIKNLNDNSNLNTWMTYPHRNLQSSIKPHKWNSRTKHTPKNTPNYKRNRSNPDFNISNNLREYKNNTSKKFNRSRLSLTVKISKTKPKKMKLSIFNMLRNKKLLSRDLRLRSLESKCRANGWLGRNLTDKFRKDIKL